MAEDRIHLYCARCDSISWEAAAPLLAPARRAHCAGLPAADRLRSALAGLLLRYACRALLDADPGDEAREAGGRPYLPAHPGFFFSLSHSSEIALCAAGPAPVGADVQKIRPISNALLTHFFTEAERAFCHDAETAVRIWCARESYGKLTGRGLSRADAVLVRGGMLCIGGYAIAEPAIAPGYQAAVCSGTPVDTRCIMPDPAALLAL